MNDYLEQIYAADAVILGSPTYVTDVTPELKALIDRASLVALANGGALKGKIGAAVVAVRHGGATHVFDTINHMFLMSSMIVPGSIYWNLGIGRDKGASAGRRGSHAEYEPSRANHRLARKGYSLRPRCLPHPPV